jgi:hypothetical protein
MTIHRDGRETMLECEECTTTTELYDNFDTMIADAKKAGWEITVAKGEWVHTCPDCKGGDRLARQRALFR